MLASGGSVCGNDSASPSLRTARSCGPRIRFPLFAATLARVGSTPVETLNVPPKPDPPRSRRATRLFASSYLSSTLAPTFSSWALIFSASSLETPSLTGLGAPSTRSLASLRPRPVIARTSLMTSIFLSPTAARMTLNSVCSSTGAAAAARRSGGDSDGGGGGNAPLLLEKLGELGGLEHGQARTGLRRSSLDWPLVFSPSNLVDCIVRAACCQAASLVGIGLDHARQLSGRSGRELRELCRGSLDEAHELRAQLVERRQGRERLHTVRVERVAPSAPPRMTNLS